MDEGRFGGGPLRGEGARAYAVPRGAALMSWWCQDDDSRLHNRWTEPRAADCRAAEAEHLVSYRTQYAYGMVVGFNYERPVRGRGAGIFLRVNGRGTTAGCVSMPEDSMRRILRWADPGGKPHIAVGTASRATAITRY